jgi:hypothetical protein
MSGGFFVEVFKEIDRVDDLIDWQGYQIRPTRLRANSSIFSYYILGTVSLFIINLKPQYCSFLVTSIFNATRTQLHQFLTYNPMRLTVAP